VRIQRWERYARWCALVLCASLGPNLFPVEESAVAADESSGLVAAAAIQDAFVKAIETAEQSVVAIARDRRDHLQSGALERRNDFFRRDRPNDPSDPNWIPNEFGAGIVIDKNGLILTNYHLVRGGPIEGRPDQNAEQMLFVRLPDRRGFEAVIYAADPRSDLAVLKIAANDLTPMKIESATPVRKGQFVIALGNPYAIARDGSASATWGIVGNLGRKAASDIEPIDLERLKAETIHHLGTLIQIDSRLELGTSGGALLNLKGDCIGMTTSLAAIVGYEKSAGFAVPFDDAMKRVIDLLKQGKEVDYGFLGVQPDDIAPGESTGPELPAIRERLRKGAVRILDAGRNLPAGRAGISGGDIVLRVGRHEIYCKKDLMREIGLTAPGEIARLTIFRPRSLGANGQELEIPVEIGKWPAVDEEGIVAPVPTREPWRGLVYDYSTCRSRFIAFPRMHEPMEGVRVIKVAPGSPVADCDLQNGDLITHVKGQPVRSPREFADAVQKIAGAVSLQVWSPVNRTNPTRSVDVRR
jgi:serine protease Do